MSVYFYGCAAFSFVLGIFLVVAGLDAAHADDEKTKQVEELKALNDSLKRDVEAAKTGKSHEVFEWARLHNEEAREHAQARERESQLGAKNYAEIQKLADDMERQVMRDELFLKEDFRENYAKAYWQDVLQIRRNEWRKSHDALLHSPALLQYVQDKKPVILEYFDCLEDVIQRAQKYAIEDELGRPKKRLSSLQIRALKVNAVDVKLDDQIDIFKTITRKRKLIFDQLTTEIADIQGNVDLEEDDKTFLVDQAKTRAFALAESLGQEGDDEKKI